MREKTGGKRTTILLALVLLFAISRPAAAQGIVHSGTIPAGTVLDSDVIITGQTVAIDGTVNGNVFALGNQVAINGEVDGSLIALGQNVYIEGQVSGGTYLTALTLDMGPEANLGRDLYAVVVSLVTQPGASVERDLFALSLDAGLGGHVGRDSHALIGPIQLFNGLMRLLGFEEIVIDLRFRPPAPPTESPPEPSGSVDHLASARLAASPTYAQPLRASSAAGANVVTQWALRALRELGVLFVLGLLALWAFRRPLENSGEQLRARPWASTAYGLLGLVISINLFGVAILLWMLAFVLGVWIGYLNLWELTLAFWTAAFSAIGFAAAALWAFVAYGSKIVVAYLLGNWVFEKIYPPASRYKALPLLLGLLPYALLRAIPTLGWVIGVLVTAIGVGAAWLAYRVAEPPQSAPPKSLPRRSRRRATAG